MQKIYSRTDPYLAAIKERYSLCRTCELKETQHIEVDLAGSGITYQVGDSLAIIPENDPLVVERVLSLMKTDGETIVSQKRTGETYPIYEFLLRKANLKEGTKPLLKALGVTHLSDEEQTLLLKGNEIVDLLEDYMSSHLSPQELCHFFKPMMPRFYSIASSMKAVGEEVHLTVALKKWEINGTPRTGVCTHYLCDLVPLHEQKVPVYIQSSNGFTLPENPETPMIMVGPGTGIAPFRAFMQEREALGASGQNWLFFGECHREDHFFYESYWRSLEQKNKLRLDLAFSRDQSRKMYVQHRILEKGKELYEWIRDGAVFYVCGDATRMAKDVDAALLQIIKDHGSLSEEDAKGYLKQLRHEKRYLRDVY